jgi:hypothetical protein
MAVGIMNEEKPRYFSIVRWGDAELTLAQVKRKLWAEKCLLWLTLFGGSVVCLAAATYAVVAQGG